MENHYKILQVGEHKFLTIDLLRVWAFSPTIEAEFYDLVLHKYLES